MDELHRLLSRERHLFDKFKASMAKWPTFQTVGNTDFP